MRSITGSRDMCNLVLAVGGGHQPPPHLMCFKGRCRIFDLLRACKIMCDSLMAVGETVLTPSSSDLCRGSRQDIPYV